MFLRTIAILSMLMIYSGDVAADDEIEPTVMSIEKGDIAPFDGTLFSTSAAAEILVQLENQSALCQIEIDKAVGIREAELGLEIERATIYKDACEEKYDAHINLKREEINFLYDRLRRSENNREAVWFGVGTATGIGVTALSVWILNSISSSAN